jgi:hypothetical protein
MAQPVSFDQQVRANFPKVQSSAEFSGNPLWLKFYLLGPPENLQEVSEALIARGWVNLGGWEGGFLYPKVQVEKSAEGVVEGAETTQELCAGHGIEILNIDADTSPDVKRSRLVTLYDHRKRLPSTHSCH